MPKTCNHPDCSYPVFSKGRCVQHWRSQYSKPIQPKKVSPIAYNKPVKGIKKVSAQQLARLAKYRVSRDEYLRANPICEYPDCNNTDVELHHGAGRCGDLLFNKQYFRSLCRQHHQLCETEPQLAKELNLSFDRINK